MKLECSYMRIQKTETACALRCDALHKSHCGKVVCFLFCHEIIFIALCGKINSYKLAAKQTFSIFVAK